MALAAGWLAACVWIDRDARYIFGSQTPWPLIMAMPGVGLFVSATLLGCAGLPALLAIMVALGGCYLFLRETTVSPSHRVLTRRRVSEALHLVASRRPATRTTTDLLGQPSPASADDAGQGGVMLARRNGTSPPAIPPGRRHRHAARADRAARDVVAQALAADATEVSLESKADGRVRLRFRIDGIMVSRKFEDDIQPQALREAFLMFTGLESSTGEPQEGGFTATVAERTVDIGVQSDAARLVLHLTDPDARRAAFRGGIEAIGASRQHADSIRWAILQPHGLLLICGPAESGKTTTAYAILGEIDPATHRIATVEDAIFHPLDAVAQTAVDATVGLTPAHLIRLAADRDADAILVDEIRDRETADAVIRAAENRTVVATLQSHDAADAIAKLIAFGIDIEKVRTAVAAVVAQRLVRVLCEHCKEPYPAPADFVEKLGHGDPEEVVVFKKRGCFACHGTGYHGRVPVQEVLVVDAPLRLMLTAEASRNRIRALARASGMHTLREAAVALVAHGATSIKEAVRCVP